MKQKVFQPDYKVRRHPGGLYSVYLYRNSSPYRVVYINRTQIGSRGFYVVENAPLFPTLRDAVMHIVFGG